jgi:myosin heavy subunit
MKFLSYVRLATASEVKALHKQLEAERAMTTKLSIVIDQQRTAISEQALQLADARDEIDAGESRRSRMQAELDRVHREKAELSGRYDKLTLQADEANRLIQRLQSERPQMRLVRNEKPLAGENNTESEPSTDEVIVPEHKVEMSARVIGIFFEGRTHWTLSANDHLFKVPVHDKDFLARVQAGAQLFGHGSVIRAEFLETIYRRSADERGEPYAERTLEHVIEVIPPPSTTNTQLDLAGTPKGASA